jgi:hypothetical protein
MSGFRPQRPGFNREPEGRRFTSLPARPTMVDTEGPISDQRMPTLLLLQEWITAVSTEAIRRQRQGDGHGPRHVDADPAA